MEVTGEISDTDSGIILHSGSDSPTTHAKDVTTHTRAMKLKHQELQDRLEICILELKKLCIREAELTGQLPKDYPLLPGEKPPQIRRRIGAAFKLDEQNIPQGSENSELTLVDVDLALQTKIYEAARKLCEEDHLSKSVRKSRILHSKTEEKKLKKLQEKAFQLRLERGRSSPLPGLNVTQQDLGTSDDSSLSDSAVQDEEVTSRSSQPSTGLHYPVEMDSPRPLTMSSHSCVDSSYMSSSAAPRSPLSNPCQSPCPSIDSKLSFSSSPAYDPPPIQHSPWSESSLDQPYQKTKKSRSSSTKSPAKSELLPPLEACLPQQLSHMRLGRTQSSSTPSTPEMRVHRQLSLRVSNPESSFHKERGRTRCPRRRLTEYQIIVGEAHSPTMSYSSCASSEDSNSERSFSIHSNSPCQEFPSYPRRQYQAAAPLCSPEGSYGPQGLAPTAFHRNPGSRMSPVVQRPYYDEGMVYPANMDLTPLRVPQQMASSPNTYEYYYRKAAIPHQRAQRPVPPDIRLTPPAQTDNMHYSFQGPPRQDVSEQLKSWHRRSQFKTPRTRSLDRQGAVRLKNMSTRESTSYQNQKHHDQVIQRGAMQKAAEEAPEHWMMDNGSHYMSQV
ncbi:innate immunity activator b isoform X2 [Poeciliopsis prolifica]|uniref:innate immunity activator b isoform X2 n=1 Tax=Poeciliopsis prolifica TaxID=188132 RepID=UPI0024131589|nr:innate immunity activator b isoform X2 [Poeciliopsis prolifica]